MYNYNNFRNDYQLDNFNMNNLDMNSFDMNNTKDPFGMYSYNMINGINQNNQNSQNKQMNLYNPEEGYEKGNLFSNLYSQYKNYKPTELKASNKRMQLWLEMSKNAFAAHEINLYLDVNPYDNSMIALFNDYRNKAEQLKKQYENEYGPICINSEVLNNTPFLWEESSFPWEGENN